MSIFEDRREDPAMEYADFSIDFRMTNPLDEPAAVFGEGDDFLYLDAAYNPITQKICLHSVVDSDSASYTADLDKFEVEPEKAQEAAEGMLQSVYAWMDANSVTDTEHESSARKWRDFVSDILAFVERIS